MNMAILSYGIVLVGNESIDCGGWPYRLENQPALNPFSHAVILRHIALKQVSTVLSFISKITNDEASMLCRMRVISMYKIAPLAMDQHVPGTET